MKPALPRIQAVLLTALFPIILGACGNKPQQAGMTMPPMPVEVQKLSEGSVADATDFVATLISRHSVQLQSQVPGQIKALYVKAGDRVKAGQLLLVVDPSRQSAAVSSAAAAAQSQRAEVVQAQENLRVLEEQRQALTSAVEVAQSQYERYARLLEQKSASQQDVEQYRDAYNQAVADLQSGDARIQAQKAMIATQQQRYQQAQSVTREQQAQLAFHRITAPFAGMVGDIPVKLGNYVQPLNPLLSVTDNDPLELNLSVPAERAHDLKVGLPVEILSEAGLPLAEAKLSFVSPQVDVDSQTILTKAIVRNPGGKLKADQLVNARLIWKRLPGLRIPTQAVVHMGGRDFVYVMEKKASKSYVARQKPVNLGRIEGPSYVVESGLQPGDTLIVAGIQKLGDGAPVQPQQ